MRDYQNPDQIGLEPTLEEYHNKLLDVTSELKRVLKPTGVMFWVHGDSYAGSGGPGGDYNEGGLRDGQPKPQKREWLDPKLTARKRGRETVNMNMFAPKCMVMQNERLIIRMIDEQGWILRNRIIWEKPNAMPSSVTDRFSNKYEPVYMLVKSKKYYFDLDAVRVPHKKTSLKRWKSGTKRVETTADVKNAVVKKINPTYITAKSGDLLNALGKNPGDVFEIPTHPYSESHFATFPLSLIEPMIKAACPAEICPECGHIRTRITKTTTTGGDKCRPKTTIAAVRGSRAGDASHTTTGWTSCSCGKEFEPGVVLDPFSGAGTTMLAARNLGRSAIGIEISADYCKLSRKRIGFGQSTIDNSIEYIYEVI